MARSVAKATRPTWATGNNHGGPPAPRTRFTLFELLVVIVLVGVATSILAVGIGRGMLVAHERSALANMVSALRSARVQAIASGQPVRAASTCSAGRCRHPGARPRAGQKTSPCACRRPAAWVRALSFYPDGAASGGDILISRGQARWRIDVSWLTGSVQVRELP